ncbi:protein of unknown function [Chitinophaga jiangningensis]|uniref:DUF4843 domain-containing protein n=1 Tax=Chitinophaga jiangningensis TaxID=1419482 RepID=A0A1M6YZ63_9BACT|nr:DUF4843 domain-containing protein [Chitinophaga jiangningensis]SHL23574.1 protein of unknown function [Chitinophaga jiangningensis]
MKQIIFIITIACLLGACRQQPLELFDQEASQSNIYLKQFFDASRKSSSAVFQTDTATYFWVGMGFFPAEVKDSVVSFAVQITGKAADHDRAYRLLTLDSTTMQEGRDYTITRAVIGAGKYIDSLQITVHRNEFMIAKPLRLDFQLAGGPELFINMPFAKTAYTSYRDSINLLKYTLYADNSTSKPYLWTNTTYAAGTLSFFGEYSPEKVTLMMKAIGLKMTDFTIMPKGGFDRNNWFVWSRYMVWWFAKEATEGRTYTTSDGKPITMGPSAQG